MRDDERATEKLPNLLVMMRYLQGVVLFHGTPTLLVVESWPVVNETEN